MLIIRNMQYFVFITVLQFTVNILPQNNRNVTVTLNWCSQMEGTGFFKSSKSFYRNLFTVLPALFLSDDFLTKMMWPFLYSWLISFVSMIQMLLIAWENCNRMTIAFSTIPCLIRAKRILCCSKKNWKSKKK